MIAPEPPMHAQNLAYSDDLIRNIFASVRRIAVVGASNNPARASFGVLNFLAGKGYTMLAVNPGLAGGIIGSAPVYAKLADVPAPIDMVDIFRNSDAAGDVVDECLALPVLPKVIWMQLEIINQAAAERAQARGITVIMDRCPHIEIVRLGLPRIA